MPAKRLDIPPVGPVALYKRRGTRSIRLSIAADGTVRVTLPTWAPYKLGIEFVRARQDWIVAHQPPPRALLSHGVLIGKAHRMVFIPVGEKISSRIVGNEIRVSYPPGMSQADPSVQAAAEKAAIRALQRQGEQLLPLRLQTLAAKHNFTYKSLKIKRLKTRWGSCDSQQNITLNLFLMQLPWDLIDYVLLHELVHTRVMRHGPPFWQAMNERLANVTELRKTIKQYQPQLRVQSQELRVQSQAAPGYKLWTPDS